MRFIVWFEAEPENRDKSFERFKASGENAPGNVKLVDMWISTTLLEGWCVVEADDAVALGEFMKHWTDLNVNHIAPVLSQEELLRVFS